MSLHDEEVYRRWPDLDRDELMRRMYVVTTAGRKLGGVHAIRYLCRKLPSLWWLAPLLHIPFSFPVWNALYSMVANRRYRIAGQIACDEHCQVHR
jgi:predicted DCC family thiol-disulfide oxidoreductase YuxK